MLRPLLLALAQDSVHAAPRDTAPIAVLERFIVAQMSQHAIPGLAIAVVDGDRIVWAKGFGRVDPTDSTRNVTAETPFRVASVSKLFTDIGVMQRVERGRFHLDSSVALYASDFAPTLNGMRMPTLRELLKHQSGIVREPPVGHYFDPTSPSLAATVASLNGKPLVFAPGTVTKYSNAAIALAGRLLELESEVPFAEVMRRDLLTPSGMSGASFAPDSAHRARRARGTMWTLDGRTFAAPIFPLGLGPARGLFGLGFALSDLDGARRIGHGGWHYGFATELAALPDERLGVALSATIDGGNAVTSRIADEALRLMRAARAGRSLTSPLVTTVIPLERRRELEGTYRSRGRTVVLEDRLGDLWLDDLRGDFPLLLRALDDSTLLADGRLRYGTRVTLHRTVNGVQALHYAGDTLVLVPDARPAPPPTRWRPIIGEYGWDHDVLHLLERDGRLFALIEWFGLYPLTEVDLDHLRFPAHGLYAGETLRIDRDAAGRVRALDLGGVIFARRAIAPDDGVTFRITPRRRRTRRPHQGRSAHQARRTLREQRQLHGRAHV